MANYYMAQFGTTRGGDLKVVLNLRTVMIDDIIYIMGLKMLITELTTS